MTISPSGPIIKSSGSNFSLLCSANIYPLPVYGIPPTVEWFFGPGSDNSFLPYGVIVSNMTNSSNNINYTTSTLLQFSPLNENHTGIYTCGIGYSATSIKISVGGKEQAIYNYNTC